MLALFLGLAYSKKISKNEPSKDYWVDFDKASKMTDKDFAFQGAVPYIHSPNWADKEPGKNPFHSKSDGNSFQQKDDYWKELSLKSDNSTHFWDMAAHPTLKARNEEDGEPKTIPYWKIEGNPSLL